MATKWGMELEAGMSPKVIRMWKERAIEAMCFLTLVMACMAVLLIEFWGLMKIWSLVFA